MKRTLALTAMLASGLALNAAAQTSATRSGRANQIERAGRANRTVDIIQSPTVFGVVGNYRIFQYHRSG